MRTRLRVGVATGCEDELRRAAEILRLELFRKAVAVIIDRHAEPQQVPIARRLLVAILHGEEDLKLRRVPVERILLAETTEQQRQLAEKLIALPVPLAEPIHSRLQAAQARLHQTFQHWERLEAEYSQVAHKKLEASREKLAKLRRDFQDARDRFQAALRDWQEAHRLALAEFALGATA